MRNKKQERRAAEAHRVARKMCAPYAEQINSTPALLSLLYDIDLLPEQIRLPVNAYRMGAVCELFSKLTDEQVKNLFENKATT